MRKFRGAGSYPPQNSRALVAKERLLPIEDCAATAAAEQLCQAARLRAASKLLASKISSTKRGGIEKRKEFEKRLSATTTCCCCILCCGLEVKKGPVMNNSRLEDNFNNAIYLSLTNNILLHQRQLQKTKPKYKMTKTTRTNEPLTSRAATKSLRRTSVQVRPNFLATATLSCLCLGFGLGLCLVAEVGRAQQAAGSRVRVLLVSNSDRRRAIEEAAALSLDVPRSQLSISQGEQVNGSHSLAALTLSQRHKPSPTSTPTSNEDETVTSPAGKQLAGTEKTGTNRGNSGRSFESSPNSSSYSSSRNSHSNSPSNLNSNSNSNSTSNTNSSPAVENEKLQNVGFNEIDMARVRPSWLNVSSRFKITGSSIEQVQFMMPPEFYLRQAFDSPILLKTKSGILEGVRSIRFNKHLYTFLSVPYAKAPVEELRFKAPQPIGSWEGVLQATKWPPFCVQPSMTLASKSSPVHPLTQMMSEDCLYLNIWTPSLKFNKNRKRPVMVWVHGGAFQYGGISVDENDGSALALAGDVVVVAMNYRISAFGFLNANNKDNGPNNVGLLDQRAALEWVQANIKQFGGDPQQVTLFGESAGGHSVGLHLISPGSQSLFKRAIMQSGVPISFLRSYDVNSDNKGSSMSEAVSSVMMAKRLKCYVSNETAVSTGAGPIIGSEPLSPSLAMEKAGNSSALPASSLVLTDSEEPNSAPSSSSNSNYTTSSSSSSSSSSTTTNSSSLDLDSNLESAYDDQPILNDETLECMREKSSLDILKAMGVPGNAGFFPTGNDLKGFFPNGPIGDSFDPENLKVGDQKDYLIGTNTDEGTFMLHYGMPALFPSRAPPKVSSVETLKQAIQEELARFAKEADELARDKANQSVQSDLRSASGSTHGGAQAHLYRPLLKTSTSVLENFMPKVSYLKKLENGTVIGNASVWTKEADFGRNVGSLITDIIFLCPARSLARTLAEAGRNVYFYLYAHRSSVTPYHDWIGVTHHDEVEFVFGRPLRLADTYSGSDIEMSQRLIKSWAHFAYTGQPLDQFGVKWPKYSAEDNEYMTLTSGEASVGQRYHDRVCNIYETVISVHLQDT